MYLPRLAKRLHLKAFQGQLIIQMLTFYYN